ncbi:uracil-DNA glycosylase [Wolfiporia cocos MD-104 SS10]|uniref:Uracil-DNA glycosylase n=1 Tax=Wolfiporia cocos (strain MD-104) TaxID=742152 RepID=A0A2H3JZY7_WOLCO|nr:uracil-DNA glycosylase [Wolfiporia cocos MD-104 SS10]
MPASSRAVYLEDLEAPATAPPPQRAPPEDAAPGATASTAAVALSASKDAGTGPGTNASKDVSTSTTASKGADTSANASKPSAGLKRQRTLTDMFGASAPAAGPAAKKIKLAGSAGARQLSTQGSLNAIPFSLSEFQASLTDAERTLLALECETMGKSWLKVLADEIRKPYFLKLKQFLHDAGVKGAHDSAKSLKVYPAPPNIYAWSNLTPLGRVKVVIIGQDPYHGPGQAHGLCFSVPPGVAVPPSLRNIYLEIKAEYPEFEVPGHGNLTAWAENGVLLLNTCLTVQANAAGSHSNRGWEDFTDRVVDVVDRFGGANLPGAAGRGRGIVFLAWGAWAAKRVAKLDKKKHLILKSAHPSPLSAHRGFMGNGHFKAANEWLANKYGADGTVDWCKL